MKVETIKRQIRVAYGWLVVGQSVGAGLAISCTPAVCDMNSAAAAAVCGVWRYTSVICLFLSRLSVLPGVNFVIIWHCNRFCYILTNVCKTPSTLPLYTRRQFYRL